MDIREIIKYINKEEVVDILDNNTKITLNKRQFTKALIIIIKKSRNLEDAYVLIEENKHLVELSLIKLINRKLHEFLYQVITYNLTYYEFIETFLTIFYGFNRKCYEVVEDTNDISEYLKVTRSIMDSNNHNKNGLFLFEEALYFNSFITLIRSIDNGDLFFARNFFITNYLLKDIFNIYKPEVADICNIRLINYEDEINKEALIMLEELEDLLIYNYKYLKKEQLYKGLLLLENHVITANTIIRDYKLLKRANKLKYTIVTLMDFVDDNSLLERFLTSSYIIKLLKNKQQILLEKPYLALLYVNNYENVLFYFEENINVLIDELEILNTGEDIEEALAILELADIYVDMMKTTFNLRKVIRTFYDDQKQLVISKKDNEIELRLEDYYYKINKYKQTIEVKRLSIIKNMSNNTIPHKINDLELIDLLFDTIVGIGNSLENILIEGNIFTDNLKSDINMNQYMELKKQLNEGKY